MKREIRFWMSHDKRKGTWQHFGLRGNIKDIKFTIDDVSIFEYSEPTLWQRIKHFLKGLRQL